MDNVATTKKLIQNLREHGWDKLISEATLFCSKQGIIVPNMTDFYADYIRLVPRMRSLLSIIIDMIFSQLQLISKHKS
jgi:hypothetical protein